MAYLKNVEDFFELIMLFCRNEFVISWEHFHLREKIQSVRMNLLMMLIGKQRANDKPIVNLNLNKHLGV